MANTLTAIIDKLLAQGLMALRQNAIMARLVNSAYSAEAGEKGSTIDVPIPSAIVAQAVSPANTPPSTADVAPTSVALPLDKWYEAPFYLTDKDVMEAMNGTIPMQASEAVKALVNQVDSDIYNEYKGIYGYVGTAGTTPFASDLSDYLNARAALAGQLCPLDSRRVMLDVNAEAKALAQRAIQDASWRQSTQGIMEAQIGRTLGADWFASQNVKTHSSTALSAGAATVNGAHGLGVKTVSIAKATNTSPLVAGDILTFAGDTQTYVVTAGVTLAVGNTDVAIEPGLKVAKSGAEAMALKASHVVNLVFHRDAIAFATRPLASAVDGLGNLIQSAVDPMSGLTLRLEISREHKRTRYSYDILYGTKLIRRELACRIAG